MDTKLYSVGEVAAITDTTVWLVDYFCKAGLVIPINRENSRRGVKRQFSFRQLLFFQLLQRLTAGGISPKKLRDALGSDNFDQAANLDYSKIITDGVHVMFLRDGEAPLDLTAKGQLLFHFVVDVAELRSHVASRVRRLEVGDIAPLTQNR